MIWCKKINSLILNRYKNIKVEREKLFNLDIQFNILILINLLMFTPTGLLR